jgi:hypothetical protein
VSSSDQLDGLDLVAVTGDAAMEMAVGSDHVGQHPGVTPIGLRARDPMAVPVAVNRQRVHRQHLIASGNQRPDEHATIGLDPDHNPSRVRIVAANPDQVVDLPDASRTIDDPARRDHRTLRVEDAHIVMIFSPVNPDEQHLNLLAQRKRASRRSPAS